MYSAGQGVTLPVNKSAVLSNHTGCTNQDKSPYDMYEKRRPRSACAFAHPDQDLRCPFVESIIAMIYR